VPAACCGLVGLKPTRGRRDMAGSNLLPVNVAVEGVLTRSVRDTIAFWTELERRAPHGSLDPIGPITPSKRRLRVAVFVDSPVKLPVHPDIRAATERAAKLCESLGHDVELIGCPFTEEEVHAFIRLWGFVAWSQVKGGRVVMCSGFDATKIEPWAAGFCRYFTRELGAAWTGIQLMRQFTARYAALMENLDVLISPTLAQPPPKLGHLRTDQPFEDGLRKLFDFIPFTPLINAAGAPALSLPLGRAEGVPIGVQFAAARRNEAVLLELALALEAASPWTQLSERVPFRPE
jgi:amidase